MFTLFSLVLATPIVASEAVVGGSIFKHVQWFSLVGFILVVLIGFSVMSWAVIFLKMKMFKGIDAGQEQFLKSYQDGASLQVLYEKAQKSDPTPLIEVFRSGYQEWTRIQRKAEGGAPVSTKGIPLENVERAMRQATNEQIASMEKYLPFLATTGSAMPFVGLFGTVWGIMNAFSGIGATGNATLATVAPGIAEALVATAVGLAAAIPAVMAFNFFNNRVRLVATQVDTFSTNLVNLLQRNVERG